MAVSRNLPKYMLTAAAMSAARRAANEGISYAKKRMLGKVYRPRYYPRPYALNAQSRSTRPKRHLSQSSSVGLAKNTLFINNFLFEILQGSDIGDRLSDRIFVRGVWIDCYLHQKVSDTHTYFRGVICNYASQSQTSGTDLFKSTTDSSVADDFNTVATNNFDLITRPFPRS